MSSVSSSSRPSSPTKPGSSLPDGLKPNPHPYSIKTTSTGILSRSATTSSSVSHSHNHYVPISPSPSPTKATHAGHAERGSRHRYSRSLTDEIPRPLPVPPEELYYQQQQVYGHARSRAETLPALLPDPNANPKLWTSEQLAENVPEIAEFVQEHDITGRAFLRFDEGVLNAYGVTQQWQRSLLLSTSRQLRQSVLKDRIWPHGNSMTGDSDLPNGRLSHSYSLSDSPTKSQPLHLPYNEDEEDPAYLSSSSSISSTSSLTGRRKRRYRPNGRVHGMVASFERSSSVDEGQARRERSGSISSVESHDEAYFYQPHSTASGPGQPLPLRPPPGGPLLLPTSSFPESLLSPFNTPHTTGNDTGAILTTPHATGNGAAGTGQRPLPAVPCHPSLRPAPSLSDEEDHAHGDAQPKAPEGGDRKNTSGEMTMDELIAVLNADAVATETSPPDARGYVNTDRHREREKGKDRRRGRKGVEGAAAWEMDLGLGETVKRAPPASAPTPAISSALEEEMSVEELLALEGGVGAAAWVDEPEGVGRTMKRVGGVENDAPASDTGSHQFGSIGRATGTGTGKGAERISLSAGRKSRGVGKKQGRRVGELFAFTNSDVVPEQADPEGGLPKDSKERRWDAEELELERMREVERGLLQAEEEERERWRRQAEEERDRREEEEKERSRQELEDAEAEVHRRREEAEKHRQLVQAERDTAERHRREAAEQDLASSIVETRRSLELFRGRLEEVERRVGEMEDTAAAASSATANIPSSEGGSGPEGSAKRRAVDEGKQGDPQTCVTRRLRALAAWALSTSLGVALPAAVGISLAAFVSGPEANDNSADTTGAETTNSNTTPMRSRRDRAARIRALYPTTISRYALLVGIGVCAIMLRGLMRWGVRGVRGMGTVGARGVRGR